MSSMIWTFSCQKMWSCPSFILSSFFSFDKFELLILGILKTFLKKGAFVFVGVIIFPFLFQSFSLWWIWHFFQVFWSIDSFHLVYLLKVHKKLNGRKWLDKMKQRNSEKNQKFLVLNDKRLFFNLLNFNFRADIMARYTFNQVRWFFTSSIDFIV